MVEIKDNIDKNKNSL